MQQKDQWVKNSTCLTQVDLGTFYPKPTCVCPRGMARVDKSFISCLIKVQVSHTYSLSDENCPKKPLQCSLLTYASIQTMCVTPYWLLQLRLWKLKHQLFHTSIPRALPHPFTQPHFAFCFFGEKARKALELVARHSVLQVYVFPNHRRWGSVLLPICKVREFLEPIPPVWAWENISVCPVSVLLHSKAMFVSILKILLCLKSTSAMEKTYECVWKVLLPMWRWK